MRRLIATAFAILRVQCQLSCSLAPWRSIRFHLPHRGPVHSNLSKIRCTCLNARILHKDGQQCTRPRLTFSVASNPVVLYTFICILLMNGIVGPSDAEKYRAWPKRDLCATIPIPSHENKAPSWRSAAHHSTPKPQQVRMIDIQSRNPSSTKMYIASTPQSVLHPCP